LEIHLHRTNLKLILILLSNHIIYTNLINQLTKNYLPSSIHITGTKIAINEFFLKGSYDAENIRAAGSLIFGDYQRRNYSAEPTAFQYLFEARVGYMPAYNLWIDAGIFPSHIGLESTRHLRPLSY
jgi:hypothetical protein